VQGDTSTAFLASFLAINFKVPVAHVEAGLRTQTKYSPFPEEINRRLISVLADFHFAPTAKARENLLREGIDEERIIVTGNTALDTLRLTLKSDCPFKDGNNIKIDPDKKLLIVTAHRRESFGEGMKNIAEAIREIAEKRSDIVIVYPVHANPNVSKPMRSMLGGCKNIFLVDPMEYHAFVALMKKAYMILTDSGGIQEEVSFLGKPTLVMRESTERPEGLMGGNVRLVGTDKGLIVGEVTRLLDDATYYQSMSKTHAAFGDGFAAQKIITAFQDYFQKNLHT